MAEEDLNTAAKLDEPPESSIDPADAIEDNAEDEVAAINNSLAAGADLSSPAPPEATAAAVADTTDTLPGTTGVNDGGDGAADGASALNPEESPDNTIEGSLSQSLPHFCSVCLSGVFLILIDYLRFFSYRSCTFELFG
jgi:hypothetical protein